MSKSRRSHSLLAALRRLAVDVRKAMNDPSVPPPIPSLQDYPVRRRR
jgi:hypothetical protein